MLGMACWWSSPAAWLHAKHALPSWSKPLQPKVKDLLQESQPPEESAELLKALNQEASQRFEQTLRGLTQYLIHPYERKTGPEGAIVWQRDGVRLIDYSGRGKWDGKTSVLIIPSLINRAYVFDLQEEASFITYMAKAGIRPLMLDWGEPSPALAHLDCAGYMERYLLPVMDWLRENNTDHRLHVAGYCMGGIFAVALAQLRREQMATLTLLATPWDFHVPEFFRIPVDTMLRANIQAVIRGMPLFPASWLQSLFYMGNHWLFHRKFQRFAAMDPESPEATDFVALEEWVNDGVNLTAAVTEECLLGWVTDNALVNGQWRVQSQAISPSELALPVFAAVPRKDRVVPSSSTQTLLDALKDAHIHRPLCGHLGIMAGRGAEEAMWQPYTQWLNR